MKTPSKILLLPICGLGDAVAYLPYLKVTRARFPQAEIVVVVATAAAGALIKDNSSEVEIVVFNRGDQKHRITSLFELLLQIRRRKFDVVISGAHPNSFRVPLFALLSGARLRIGSDSEKLSFLYHRRIDVSTHAHYSVRYQKLLSAVGVAVSEEEAKPKLFPPREAMAAALRLWSDAGLEGAEMVIGLVSGADTNARGIWQPSLKRWNNQGYAKVARWAAHECGARVVMIGSGAESPLAEEIARLSGVAVVNFCGKTSLKELQWIIAKCSAIVSNDTGTMHLAGALGTQVLSLFGPTSSESFRPPGGQSRVIQGQAPCAPCYPYPTCGLKTCRAMDDISVPQVIDHLSKLLSLDKTSNVGHAATSRAIIAQAVITHD